MKEFTFLLVLFVMAFSIAGNAQLEMNSDGKVAIGYDDDSYAQDLNIRTTLGDGENEDAGFEFRCDDVNSQFRLLRKRNTYSSLIRFKTGDSYKWNMGVPKSSWGPGGDGFFISTDLDTDTAYAFWISEAKQVGIRTSNPYSNYALTVRGDAYSTGQWEGSDINMKKNIQNLESPLEKVQQMRGISFNFKPSVFGISSDHNDSTEIIESDSTQKNPIAHKPYSPYLGPRYGVVAQEIINVAPELVQKMDDGTLAVNYNGFIPLLIEAVKEQQDQIQKKDQQLMNDSIKIAVLQSKIFALEDRLALSTAILEQVKAECCTNLAEEKSNEIQTNDNAALEGSEQQAQLYQNRPNPFTESTLIEYYLPESSVNPADPAAPFRSGPSC